MLVVSLHCHCCYSSDDEADVQSNYSTSRRGGRDSRDIRGGRDTRSGRDSHDGREIREIRDSREGRERYDPFERYNTKLGFLV